MARNKQSTSIPVSEPSAEAGSSSAPAQTLVPVNLAIEHLPPWLPDEIRADGLSICLWSCRTGEGVDELSREFGSSVTGLESDEAALAQALERFPQHRFQIAEQQVRAFDVVLWSTLERLQSPTVELDNLLRLARRYAVLLVPLREEPLGPDRRARFDFSEFPIEVGDYHLLAFRVIDSAGVLDDGRLALAVYGNAQARILKQFHIARLSRDLQEAAQNLDGDAVRARLVELQGQLAAVGQRFQTDAARRLEESALALQQSMRSLEAVQNSRAYKIGQVIHALRHRPVRTALTGARWLTGQFRRRGIGLVGALEAADPVRRVRDELDATKRALNGVLPSLGQKTTDNQRDLADIAPGRAGRVSVVLPVYNHADLLDEAIRSVLEQTWRDLELIVVNDGSTDGVERVLEKYVEDPRVVVLMQENQKLPAALNQGFGYATGEYYTWTSADNIMLPRQLERMVEHLRANPAQAMVYSDYRAIDAQGKPLADPNFRPQNQDPSDPSVMRLPREITVENFHQSGDNFLGASFLYRRSAALMVGAWASDTFGGEDYDYWLRIHTLFDIGHIAEILYLYRVHENTLNAKAVELKLFDNIRRLLERDQQRRAAMEAEFAFEQVGTSFDLPASEEPTGLICAYSARRSKRVEAALADPARLTVCWVDAGTMLQSEGELDGFDLILVQSNEHYSALASRSPDRVFVLDPTADRDLVIRLAKYRAFQKSATREKPLLPARPFVPRKLRIALQTDTIDKGGLEQVVFNLATALDPDRFEVSVVVNSNEPGYLGGQLEERGIPVLLTGGSESKLEKIIDEQRFDLVNLHYSILGLPHYRHRGIPSIYTLHNSYTWLPEAEGEARREAFKGVSDFIAVSSQVARYAQGRFGIERSRLQVIPNGVAPDHFVQAASVTREELGLSDSDVVFVNLAAINGVKGHHLMISAMQQLIAEHPNFRLLCLGAIQDRPLHESLVRRIAEHGLERHVKLLGFQPRERVGGILALADCFVLPSVQEGWSNAIMEAMYYGLPLILTDTGSARDLLAEAELGILIPPAYDRIEVLTLADLERLARHESPPNLEQLKNAMVAIAGDLPGWKARARAGRRLVEQTHTLQRQTEQYAEAFIRTWAITGRQHRDGTEAVELWRQTAPSGSPRAWLKSRLG